MLIHLAERVARALKRDPAYSLDRGLSNVDLALVGWYRLLMLWRGLWRCLWLRRSELPFFVGRQVTIRHAHLLRVGRSVTIEDGVHIDALSRHGIVLGDRVSIGKHTIIEATGILSELGDGLVMGHDSNLGDYCYLGAGGGVKIGENVLVGQRVSFHAADHIFARTDIPIKHQGSTQKGITVDSDCWLGSGATILDGVTIHRGAVVAAGSVVTKDVPAFTVVAGVPARVIRARGSESPQHGEETGC